MSSDAFLITCWLLKKTERFRTVNAVVPEDFTSGAALTGCWVVMGMMILIQEGRANRSRVRKRTLMLTASTSTSNTRAPAQACRCQSSYGEMA